VVEDLFTYQAGMSGTNSKGNKTSIEGDFIQKNGVLSSNDVVLDTHDHGGVVRGGSNTDGPNK
jgi:phage baseplate assembly protein gpV